MGIGERRWIAAEIQRLDPVADADRVVLLSTNMRLPRLGRGLLLNLLYTLGFLRVSGQREGALAVDRAGAGKVHRDGDGRARDTVGHFALWIGRGPGSAEGRASLARVKAMHEHYEAEYVFSSETLVHTICLFTVQFEALLRLIGAEGYSEHERLAQVTQWREVGAQLGVKEMPRTWDGMEDYLREYESDARWFGRSAEGERCARALIAQFTGRLPRGTRGAGALAVRCMVEDHVLDAVGQPRPPRVLSSTLRAAIRTGMRIEAALFPDPRELIDPATLLGDAGL